MRAQEVEVHLIEVPPIVHGGPQQALCTDDIEEQAEDPLPRGQRRKRMTTGSLEVIDDGGTVANDGAVGELHGR